MTLSELQIINVYLESLYPEEGFPRFLALLPGEAQVLGGHLFPDCASFVHLVADALVARPDLFPRQAVLGAPLADQQDRADAWLVLRDNLRRLAGMAEESYLKEQGEGVRTALSVVKSVRMEDQLDPMPGEPDRIDRFQTLIPALDIWNQWQARKKNRRIANAEPPPAGPGPAGDDRLRRSRKPPRPLRGQAALTSAQTEGDREREDP